MRLRWVRSSAAMTGMKYGVPVPFTNSATARPVLASTLPTSMFTLRCCTSRRAFCKAMSGTEPSSSMVTSTGRLATLRPACFQYSSQPSTSSRPDDAAAPVSGASKPMRMGLLWASTLGNDNATKAATSAAARNLRRVIAVSFIVVLSLRQNQGRDVIFRFVQDRRSSGSPDRRCLCVCWGVLMVASIGALGLRDTSSLVSL